MRCSVVMATCNGERFLREQLTSLASQTRLPDELIVCDDASNDRTLDILTEFAVSAPFPVRVTARPSRLGVKDNFTDALQRATGEVVFICDQDDVWLPSKIERSLREFARHGVHAVATDAVICDEELRRVGPTIANAAGLSNGSCNAYTRQFLHLALPVPDTPTSYDGWLYSLSRWMKVRADVREVHQLWRRHDTAVSGWKQSPLRRRLRLPGQLQRLERLVVHVDSAKRLRLLNREIANLDVISERLDDWLASQVDGDDLHEAATRFSASIQGRKVLAERRMEMIRKPRFLRLPAVIGLLAHSSAERAYTFRLASIDLVTRSETKRHRRGRGVDSPGRIEPR